MKKMMVALFAVACLAACDNSAKTEGNAKDSLDSVANAKKDKIDSSSEVRKDVIDSTTEKQKDAIDRVDSLNHRKDSVTH